MKTESPKKNNSSKKQNQSRNYARYSGLAFQMLASILIGLWLGMKVDEWMGNETPIFTAISILLFIFASLYLTIKSLPKQ
ncbi:AtpZ/AtpI family protein [Bacteroidota bacterium]